MFRLRFAPLRMTWKKDVMRSPDAEGEGDGDWPRLVSVKRTTGTERPGASLFERSEFAMRTAECRERVAKQTQP